MDIECASKELYSKLRNNNEVVGIGVHHSNGIQYIVVYLAQASNTILKKIPSLYKGNNVKIEIMGNIILQ